MIEDFASAIPVEVTNTLLSVPYADRAPLRGWSLAILGALKPKLTARQKALGIRSVMECIAYLKIHILEWRKHPRNPEHDVLTRLISNEASGAKLSEAELMQNCVFNLNAGHETSTNLIGNALAALTEHPVARTKLLFLQERLALNLTGLEAYLNPVIGEFLHFGSINQLSNRRALRDTQIGGVAISAGCLLTLRIGAANRDPAQFDQPNQLLLMEREDNRHLAFVLGIHQCAGVSPARLEGRIAIGRFLQRFPACRLAQPPTVGGRACFSRFLQKPFGTA